MKCLTFWVRPAGRPDTKPGDAESQAVRLERVADADVEAVGRALRANGCTRVDIEVAA